MSWIEKIKTNYIITTGDGKQYTPLWTEAKKEIEYNISEFNFPEQRGTFVDRREQKGNKYSIQIVFQGENHLDTQAAFEESARNRKPWTVEHPMYGRLTVQPVSLMFDNTGFNTTVITGTIIETIEKGSPSVNQDPVDVIAIRKSESDDAGAVVFTGVPPNQQSMLVNTSTFKQAATNSGAPGLQAEEYFNLFNDANAAIVNVTSEPLAAIRAVQRMIEAPARFEISLKNRLEIFQNQFDTLITSLETISGLNGKILFETNAGALITSMCLAASLPQPQNYSNMTDVLSVIDLIVSNSNIYIESLDSLQTANGGNLDSYIPNFEYVTSITSLVNYTVSELFSIALDARQERTIFLESDSNIILLAHRFYGLNATDDSTIDELMATNNIGLSEILGIVAGRRILYYV